MALTTTTLSLLCFAMAKVRANLITADAGEENSRHLIRAPRLDTWHAPFLISFHVQRPTLI